MRKNKQKLLPGIWIAVIVIIRILYLFFKQNAIVDTYGFFANAMIQMNEKEPILTSGLAYAYTQNISALLRFFGNNIEIIPVYHLVLQIVWLVLVFLSIVMLWGKTAGIVTGSILAFSPLVLYSINQVITENYYMLFWSIVLFLISIFYRRTMRSGWYRSNICELILMFIGFGMGLICIWNYLSWLLIPIIIYVLIRNRHNIKDKILMEAYKEDSIEKYQIMPVSTQSLIIMVGILVGMFATLMKYTGLTGWSITEQFMWWVKQYTALPDQCQDLNTWMSILLVSALGIGVICQIIVNRISESILRRKTIAAMQEIHNELVEKEEPKQFEPEKIHFFENPLPVPPKHVPKKMNFDLEELKRDLADFDIKEISGKEDFDIE